MWTIQSAEIEGNNCHVTLAKDTAGTVTTELLTWGRNSGETNAQIKQRVKGAVKEALAARNLTKSSKLTIPFSELQ